MWNKIYPAAEKCHNSASDLLQQSVATSNSHDYQEVQQQDKPLCRCTWVILIEWPFIHKNRKMRAKPGTKHAATHLDVSIYFIAESYSTGKAHHLASCEQESCVQRRVHRHAYDTSTTLTSNFRRFSNKLSISFALLSRIASRYMGTAITSLWDAKTCTVHKYAGFIQKYIPYEFKLTKKVEYQFLQVFGSKYDLVVSDSITERTKEFWKT